MSKGNSLITDANNHYFGRVGMRQMTARGQSCRRVCAVAVTECLCARLCFFRFPRKFSDIWCTISIINFRGTYRGHPRQQEARERRSRTQVSGNKCYAFLTNLLAGKSVLVLWICQHYMKVQKSWFVSLCTRISL